MRERCTHCLDTKKVKGMGGMIEECPHCRVNKNAETLHNYAEVENEQKPKDGERAIIKPKRGRPKG